MRKLKLLTGLAAVGGAAFGAKKYRTRNADWLRNDQGVGPNHQKGTGRGEELAFEKGIEPGGNAAGRPIGGLDPS